MEGLSIILEKKPDEAEAAEKKEIQVAAHARKPRRIGTDDVRIELVKEPGRVYKRIYRCKAYADADLKAEAEGTKADIRRPTWLEKLSGPAAGPTCGANGSRPCRRGRTRRVPWQREALITATGSLRWSGSLKSCRTRSAGSNASSAPSPLWTSTTPGWRRSSVPRAN